MTVLDGLEAFFAAARPGDTVFHSDRFHVLIAFGSDHKLCGNYNEVIADQVVEHLSAVSRGQTTVLCVGAQLSDALADRSLAVSSTFMPAVSADGLGRLANQLTQWLDQIEQGPSSREIAVDLAYMARWQAGSAPCIWPLLPFSQTLQTELRKTPWNSRSLPTFSMPAPDLFAALVRAHIFAGLLRAAAEALLTENSARLTLMQQAERSVKDRLDALDADANALRQSEITAELLDIIAGFEALKHTRSAGVPLTQGRRKFPLLPRHERTIK